MSKNATLIKISNLMVIYKVVQLNDKSLFYELAFGLQNGEHM